MPYLPTVFATAFAACLSGSLLLLSSAPAHAQSSGLGRKYWQRHRVHPRQPLCELSDCS